MALPIDFVTTRELRAINYERDLYDPLYSGQRMRGPVSGYATWTNHQHGHHIPGSIGYNALGHGLGGLGYGPVGHGLGGLGHAIGHGLGTSLGPIGYGSAYGPGYGSAYGPAHSLGYGSPLSASSLGSGFGSPMLDPVGDFALARGQQQLHALDLAVTQAHIANETTKRQIELEMIEEQRLAAQSAMLARGQQTLASEQSEGQRIAMAARQRRHSVASPALAPQLTPVRSLVT